MNILREAKRKTQWMPDKIYRSSFYNHSKSKDKISVIYNAATGAIVTLKSEQLEKMRFSNYEIRSLAENGFLVTKEKNEFEDYFRQISFKPKGKINYFTIIPTTACNAHCFYCYEEKYHIQRIGNSSHSKIVNYIARSIEEQDTFVLDWYGGEPLLCVDEIDQLIRDLSTSVDLSHKTWSSSITTNATLFSDELISHAVKVWHLDSAYITIDGVEADHNRRKNVSLHEGNAFRKTCHAILGLLEAGVYVNLRIHLDRNNQQDFPEILNIVKCYLKFPKFHLFPTFLFPPEQYMPESYLRDTEKESLFYDVFEALSRIDYGISLTDYFPWPKLENCFASKQNTVVIAPDGSVHSCVQEFEGKGNRESVKFSDYSNFCFQCRPCKYFPICLGGCIHNRSLQQTVRTPCIRNRFVVNPLLELTLDNLFSL